MKISVVVPTYNEEIAIAGNVHEIVKALEGLGESWELILVNDGSRDNTLSIIQGLARDNSNIKVVSYPVNKGRGFALRIGFRAAQGDYIIATESDLTWGSKIFGRFLRELEKGETDMVIASPHMEGGKMENVPFLRWLLSYLGNIIFSFALPGHLTMCTGMTRAYRREVLDALDLESDDKDLHVEILYKALDLGFRVTEIPSVLRWKKPEPGVKVRKSHFKFKSIFKHLLLSFGIQPFLLFGTAGFSLIGLGAIFSVYLLILSVLGTRVAGRPLLFVAVLLILVGFQTLIFGFLANQSRELKRQLSRMARDTRKK
ncbi:MAG: family 2 glycosyl transferase [Parcubacteria group bacterium Athens1014_26]|nr:MAG: family 2 glycosyl transferase [Parcubacteria group bacterium Athens1014_26]